MAFNKLYQTFGELRDHSSAVSSVLYFCGQARHEKTNSGSYIYQGDDSSFHDSDFCTRLHTKGKKGQAYVEVASKLVDVRGDAFVMTLPSVFLQVSTSLSPR